MADRDPHGVVAVLGRHPRVVASYGRHRAVLHGAHRLTAREGRSGRLRLDGPPELLLRELLEGTSLPLAVVALGQLLVGAGPEWLALAGGDLAAGLPAAFERAGHGRREAHARKPLADRDRLLYTGVVEVDSGQAPGEDSGGVGRRTAVSHEDDGGHSPEVSGAS